jgi:hypothetical protein
MCASPTVTDWEGRLRLGIEARTHHGRTNLRPSNLFSGAQGGHGDFAIVGGSVHVRLFTGLSVRLFPLPFCAAGRSWTIMVFRIIFATSAILITITLFATGFSTRVVTSQSFQIRSYDLTKESLSKRRRLGTREKRCRDIECLRGP